MRTSTNGDMLSEALAYAARGWAVFPVKPGGKAPATRHGVKDATVDPAPISRWWHESPDANIGVATGRISGLYVIDLDGPVGVDNWEACQLVYGDAPTLMATTGKGLHLYYSVPFELDLRNTAGALGAHIDSRGTGGYVLAPPSLHPNGARYEWVTADAPLAPLPEWVVGRLRHDQAVPGPTKRWTAPAYRAVSNDAAAVRVLRDECQDVSVAQEGTRNHALFTASLKMGGLVTGGDLLALDTYEALLSAGLACGLPEEECKRTIESGLRLGGQHPRVIRTRRMQ